MGVRLMAESKTGTVDRNMHRANEEEGGVGVTAGNRKQNLRRG